MKAFIGVLGAEFMFDKCWLPHSHPQTPDRSSAAMEGSHLTYVLFCQLSPLCHSTVALD